MKMDYTEISIRITFPLEIREVIRREKERFVSQYGSKYKSAPHITLYLARYTTNGVHKLIADLKGLALKEFAFELLGPKMNSEGDRNAYIVDVSNKEAIEELHIQITSIASRYESPLLRDADQRRMAEGKSKEPGPWYPHITLGTIPADASQPDFTQVEENLHEITGKQIEVSGITIFVYGKEKGEEKAKLIEEVTIPFAPSTTEVSIPYQSLPNTEF